MSTELAHAEKTADEHAEKHGAHQAAGEHGGHGGASHGGGSHGGHDKHKKHEEHAHHGPPPWLISFGDMMTLFLCFFIILVTMAKTQDAGLVARGLGPFVVALESKGMDAALSGAKCLNAVNDYRERFGLEPITQEELLEGRVEAKNAGEVAALLDAALRPYTTLPQPLIARFEADSADLSKSAKNYLDLIADSLRPGFGQVLILEGHAKDAGATFDHDDAWLAQSRARSVRDYLVEKQGFIPQRVEARAWAVEPASPGGAQAVVDARLIQPVPKDVE